MFFVLIFVFITFPVKSESKKDNPMASFMGVKWGTSAFDFINNFKYKHRLKKYQAFYLRNFKLGDMVIEEIDFIFKPKDGLKLKFKKKNYGKLFFVKAVMHISPDQFEDLSEIFKIKYGEPFKFKEYEVQNRMGAKFLQKSAIWVDTEIERMIIMQRLASKITDGLIVFAEHDPDSTKEDKKKKKKAADEL